MNPLVLYGGTFDPVHEGHLAIARAVADALGAPVHLLPSADPPHRPPPGAVAMERARMLDLACAGDSRLRVDRRELYRSGPSYTSDTLREVRAGLVPGTPLVWVMGLDSLVQLHSWHAWQSLFEFSHVVAVERPGTRPDAAFIGERAPQVLVEIGPRWRPVSDLCHSPAGGFALLRVAPLRQESATEVRRRIAEGRDWSDLVPPSVAAHIRGQGLYGAATDTHGL